MTRASWSDLVPFVDFSSAFYGALMDLAGSWHSKLGLRAALGQQFGATLWIVALSKFEESNSHPLN